MSRKTRRGMLYSLGATSAAALGIGSVAASPERGLPDHANGRGNEDFDPHQLGQINGFRNVLENANENARENILEKLDDEQKEALADAIKPRYVTVDTTTTIEENGDVEEISETEIRVIEENADVAEKWDWDANPIPETDEEERDEDSLPNANGSNTETPVAASAARAGDRYGEVTGDVNASVDTTYTSWTGVDGYTYKHDLSYNYKYEKAYGTSYNEEIYNVSSMAYATHTTWDWTYAGEAASDTNVMEDSDGNERVYATKMGRFEYIGSSLDLGIQYAMIDLKGVRGHVSTVTEDANY